MTDEHRLMYKVKEERYHMLQ
ncbi:hypothetical protein [Ferruginibacter sp.]